MLLLPLIGCTSVSLVHVTVEPNPVTTVIHDVSVYPGTGDALVPHQDVRIEGGRIASVTPTAAAPSGVTVVEGAGRTLLPGLVDAHVHLTAPLTPPWAPSLPKPADTAAAWLRAGVTTVYDMGGDPDEVAKLAANPDLPRIRYAGSQITWPGAHPAPALRALLPGPVAGMLINKLHAVDTPEAAAAAVPQLGGEYVKIIYDSLPPGSPHMSREVLAAAVTAAHANGKKAVVHVGTATDALDAAEVGADVLAHAVYHGGFTEEQAARLRNVTVIPTLDGFGSTRALVAGTWKGDTLDHAILDDATLALTEGEAGKKFGETPVLSDMAAGIDADMASGVRALYDAGVPLVVGTDAPLPALTPGAALHHELAALVAAGIPSAVVLEGATGRAAKVFDPNPDFGMIEVGKSADLLLVDGDPLADIHATEAIVGVWRAGRKVGW